MSPRRKRSSSQSLVRTAFIPALRNWSRNASAVSRSSKSRTTAQSSYVTSPTWTSAPLRLFLRNILGEPCLALRLLALVEFLLQVPRLLGSSRVGLGLLDDLSLELLGCRFVLAHRRTVDR